MGFLCTPGREPWKPRACPCTQQYGGSGQHGSVHGGRLPEHSHCEGGRLAIRLYWRFEESGHVQWACHTPTRAFKALLETTDVWPKKGNGPLRLPKHRGVRLLQKLTGVGMEMCQEQGLTSRKNTVERIDRLHGCVSIVDARKRHEEKASGTGAGEGMLTQ